MRRPNGKIHREYSYRRNGYEHKGPFRFIKGLLLAIFYLIALVVFALIIYIILDASQENVLWMSLIVSLSMFSWGGLIFFDSRGWEAPFRHVDKIITTKKKKIDEIGGLIMTVVFGLGIIYSIVKLIIFYFNK